MTQLKNRTAILIAGAGVLVGIAIGGMIFADGGHHKERDGHHLSQVQASAAKKAALRSAGSGKVTGVESKTRRGVAYEVEVTKPGGRRVDVLLNKGYKTLSVQPADKEDSDHEHADWRSDD